MSYKDDPYFTYTKRDGEKKTVFHEEIALSIFLRDEVVCINSSHWKETDKDAISVFVICNDLFVYASADAQTLPYSQIQTLYDMYLKDKRNGSDVWCCIQRNMMPIKEVEEEIREMGIWDLDSYNLEPNILDGFDEDEGDE